jgi:hypothetical protein
MVESTLPAFFREGDHASLRAMIFNQSGQELKGAYEFLAENIPGSKTIKKQNNFRIKDNGREMIEMPIKLPAITKDQVIQVQMKAKADSFNDGELQPITVLARDFIYTLAKMPFKNYKSGNVVNYSFQIIDDEAVEEGKMSVLLVAAKKTILQKYVDILKRAGLQPKGIEPETLALQRSLYNNPTAIGASIIVNMGAQSSQIIISYKGFVRFTRSVNVGGETMSKLISQELSLDAAQAEEYKKTYGMDAGQGDGKIFNVIKPVFDNILGEINRSKMYYTSHSPSVTISKVILSGGTALMPGLLFYIASNLDCEVELANPWKNILLSSKLQKDKDVLIEQGPVYVTSVGLALKEV